MGGFRLYLEPNLSGDQEWFIDKFLKESGITRIGSGTNSRGSYGIFFSRNDFNPDYLIGFEGIRDVERTALYRAFFKPGSEIEIPTETIKNVMDMNFVSTLRPKGSDEQIAYFEVSEDMANSTTPRRLTNFVETYYAKKM
ncbi:MAG: hypothetical protein JSV63_02640 [Candidatus Aenigmatarchaeota archaeon]|nr:MAG: hypothetical protein JSV63_02640 [Candidatus Aenigmarchaeota archaeon]